jgi:hypothetical protein
MEEVLGMNVGKEVCCMLVAHCTLQTYKPLLQFTFCFSDGLLGAYLFTRNSTAPHTIILVSAKKLGELHRTRALFARPLHEAPGWQARNHSTFKQWQHGPEKGEPAKAGRKKGSKLITDRSSNFRRAQVTCGQQKSISMAPWARRHHNT